MIGPLADGRNGVLLLNVPPDRRGLIHESDIRSLVGLRRILDRTFQTNLASGARVEASSDKDGHPGGAVLDGEKGKYWTTPEAIHSAVLELHRHCYIVIASDLWERSNLSLVGRDCFVTSFLAMTPY